MEVSTAFSRCEIPEWTLSKYENNFCLKFRKLASLSDHSAGGFSALSRSYDDATPGVAADATGVGVGAAPAAAADAADGADAADATVAAAAAAAVAFKEASRVLIACTTRWRSPFKASCASCN